MPGDAGHARSRARVDALDRASENRNLTGSPLGCRRPGNGKSGEGESKPQDGLHGDNLVKRGGTAKRLFSASTLRGTESSAGKREKEEGLMGIIGWIVLGLCAGAIAKLIMPGEDPGGFFVTMLIGIAGAIVGGLIASALDIGDLDEFFDIGTWLIAIAGSLLLLFIYRMIIGNRTTSAYR
jgi:uncharacterized membrane protein YeaQ/YmgE (transglycosylase-associated protein family)